MARATVASLERRMDTLEATLTPQRRTYVVNWYEMCEAEPTAIARAHRAGATAGDLIVVLIRFARTACQRTDRHTHAGDEVTRW